MPGLAVVIVGCRKDSESYVRMKRKACAEVGIKSFDVDLPEEVSEAELISKVHELNANPDVHGIMITTSFYSHIRFTELMLIIHQTGSFNFQIFSSPFNKKYSLLIHIVTRLSC